MGRRPNQAQEATLDIGEQDVLLGLVEAMNLIDEKNGLLLPVLQTDSRLRDDTAYISDVALHPAQPFKS